MATKLRLFLDASVIIAGIASLTGASGIILSLCEAGQVQAVVSEAILDECQRNIQRKLPEMMPRFQRVMKALKLEVVPYPPLEQVRRCEEIIHRKDAHILAAAIEAGPDYLITLDATHFLKDPLLGQKSGLRIVSPGYFLEEVIRTGSTGEGEYST